MKVVIQKQTWDTPVLQKPNRIPLHSLNYLIPLELFNQKFRNMNMHIMGKLKAMPKFPKKQCIWTHSIFYSERLLAFHVLLIYRAFECLILYLI